MKDEDDIEEKKEVIVRFLDTQEREIELRQEELEVRKSEGVLQHQSEIERINADKEKALASISAQKDDRKTQMETAVNIHRREMRLYTVALVLLSLIIIAAMFLGFAEQALEIAKLIGAGLAGYLAGNFHGANKQIEKNQYKDE